MTKTAKQLLGFIERYEALIVLLLVAVILRLPSLHEPYWYGDEGVYLTLGQALRRGLVWYRDIHDNKPPLLYLIAALAGNVMWFRLWLMVWNLANVVVVWKLAQKFFSRQIWVILSTILFVLASSLPPLEGNIANAEIFMILPIGAAMLILLDASKVRHYFFAGLLFAAGFLFKVPAAFDFAAAFVWLVFLGGWNLRHDKQVLAKFGVLLGGFFLPILLTFAYYFAVGAGGQYLVAAFLQNIGYLGSWSGAGERTSVFTSQGGLLLRGLILVLVTIGIWWSTRDEEPARRLLPVWLAFALFGALLSERPYPHYLIQIIIPAVLLLPNLFLKEKKSYALVIVALTALTVGAILKYKFYFYSTVPYYRNFVRYVTGAMSVADYRNSFDGSVQRNYDISLYIKQRSLPSDKIFVWADEPFIYALSDRLPVGRYTVAYHIVDFKGQEATLATITVDPPLFIVIEANHSRRWDELLAFTDAHYVAVATFDDAAVYRRFENGE